MGAELPRLVDGGIPDGIEPYTGYKALCVVSDDSLTSPSYPLTWPKRERLEAVCAVGPSVWTWVPIEGEPRELDATIEVSPGSIRAVTMTVAMSATHFSSSSVGRPLAPTRPPKPNNPLPPGWNWSWEPLSHDAPQEECSCGVYVADRPDNVLSYLRANGVIAEIKLWGNVIPGTSGARGQYAYPSRLLAPTQIVDEIKPVAEAYGVPILVLDAPAVVEEPEPPPVTPSANDPEWHTQMLKKLRG